MSIRRMPCRRWVAMTPTMVTAAIGMHPPGMVSSRENAPAVPTMAAPSIAARLRSGSVTELSWAISSSVGRSLKASSMARRKSGTSSGDMVRSVTWSVMGVEGKCPKDRRPTRGPTALDNAGASSTGKRRVRSTRVEP